MLKVALTGGIGSGKSTAADIFLYLGIGIYNSDRHAKQLMTTSLKPQITSLLGPNAYLNDNSLNTHFISQQIFNNQDLLIALNSIVHPAVTADYLQWCQSQTYAPYTIIETALLIESGLVNVVDKVILTTAPLPLRVLRTTRRDSATKEQIQSRIQNQTPDSTLSPLADFIIDTSALISPQVFSIHSTLLSFAK